MASTQSTTSTPWGSTPTRYASTRFVKREQNGHAVKRSEKSGQHTRTSKQGRIAELPPPGPSNIMVTTASPLPAPKKIGSA